MPRAARRGRLRATDKEVIPMPTLVAYGSRHGSTREVAEAIAATLRDRGLAVDLRPAGEVAALDGYDAVILGGALYAGRWHADARRLLRRRELATLPVAVFALGPHTLSEEDVAGSRAQLDRVLARVPDVEPIAVAIFGGVIDPAQLRFPFSRMPASDARDWDAIRAWAASIAARIARKEVA
jgi:menaquinone-dependent protoporphyrinogen oxidase